MDERLKTIEEQKQIALNENNNVYNNILKDNENLYNMNKDYVNQYQTIQDDVLNKQLDNNIQKIEEQKREAQRNKDEETAKAQNAYNAYINPYGYQAESLAGAGLNNSGVSETAKLGAFNTYQNRVSNANKALQSAFTQYNQAINDARLNNDVQKAQNALEALKMNIDFANSYYGNKATYSVNQLNANQNVDNNYYNRYQDAITQANYEKEQAEKIRQYNEQFAYQKERDKIADNQWEKQYALSKKSSSGGGSGGNSSYDFGSQKSDKNETDAFGNSVDTQNKSNYYWKKSNGNYTDQPSYIYNARLTTSGVTAGDIDFNYDGVGSNYRVWKGVDKNGKTAYYVWNDKQKSYMNATSAYNKFIN